MRRSERIATEILDLLEYNFPMMEERLRFRDDPPPRLREFSEKDARSDALVIITIVTQEYNKLTLSVIIRPLQHGHWQGEG